MTVRGALRLAQGEDVLFVTDAVLYESRSTRKYEGSSSGFSVRIVRGLSYRVGASRGTSVTTQRIAPLCDGTFYITTQRSIFIGSLRSIEVSHDDLLAFDALIDGLQLHSSRSKTLCLVGFKDAERAALTLSGVLNGETPLEHRHGKRSISMLGDGRRRGASPVSPGLALAVIIGAFVVVLVVAMALGARARNEATDHVQSSQQVLATKPHDAIADLVARCGPPARDLIENEGARSIRRLEYPQQGLLLTYQRDGMGPWSLTLRSSPRKRVQRSLTASENALPCARGLLAFPREDSRPNE